MIPIILAIRTGLSRVPKPALCCSCGSYTTQLLVEYHTRYDRIILNDKDKLLFIATSTE